MMSFTQVLLRIGAIAAAVVGLAAHYAWGDVLTNHDGRFTVSFPGKVTESTQTIDTKKGVVVAHIYSYQASNSVTYTALYSDYPAGSVGQMPAETIYDGAINGAIGQAGGTLKSSTIVEANGVVGREAVFDAPSQRESVRVRYFLIGDRLYQVAYDGPAGSESGKDANAFLESFKIAR